MNMKILSTAVFTVVSVSLIGGCESPLSDAQILDSANQYAIARGICLQDYDVSISPSGAAQRTSSPGAPDFSQKVKTMSGANTRIVTYTPKSGKHNGIYTFYVNKNTGKLVMVMKRK